MTEATVTQADERSPAQFFFEMGFGACYAEAMIRDGSKAPFPLSDAEIERQWAISQEAYEDPAELEAMLARTAASQASDAGKRQNRLQKYLVDEAQARERLATFPDTVRQRLTNWQEGQSEWFGCTVLEIVAEFIAFEAATLSPPTSGEALTQLQAMGQEFDATSGEEMRLVPVEPTEAMYLAAFSSDHWGGVQPIRRVVDEIWSSMLRAALTKGADRHD